MPQEYTIGDLMIIELALVSFIKGLDLSMQAGQQISQIIGKTEYKIQSIQEAATAGAGAAVQVPKGAPPINN